jgi:hypothetical protein
VAQTVTISLPVEGITLGSDMTVDGGDGLYRYLWTDEQGQSIGSSDTLYVNRVGTYYLQVTDGQDCSAGVKFNVNEVSEINNSGIKTFSIQYIEKQLTVLSEKCLEQVRIVDVSGHLMKKISSIRQSGKININVGDVRNGLYFVACVFSDGTLIIKKIIIK